MIEQKKEKPIIFIVAWTLTRLFRLNIMIFAIPLLLAIIRISLEPDTSFWDRFPNQLYTIALFLSSLTYIFGVIYKMIPQKLWDKKIELQEFEKKYFKAAMLVCILTYATGLAIYFIDFYK